MLGTLGIVQFSYSVKSMYFYPHLSMRKLRLRTVRGTSPSHVGEDQRGSDSKLVLSELRAHSPSAFQTQGLQAHWGAQKVHPHSYSDPTSLPQSEGWGPWQPGPLFPEPVPPRKPGLQALAAFPRNPKRLLCILRVSFAYYLGKAFAFPTCSKLQAD